MAHEAADGDVSTGQLTGLEADGVRRVSAEFEGTLDAHDAVPVGQQLSESVE